MGCSYLLATQDIIVGEGQFCLSDGSTVYTAEVHAIKQEIADALRKSLGELDIFSDQRSALQAQYSLVPRHKAVARIRDLVKNNGFKVHMHWIKTHVGYAYNQSALAKGAAVRHTVDEQIPFSYSQVKRLLLG